MVSGDGGLGTVEEFGSRPCVVCDMPGCRVVRQMFRGSLQVVISLCYPFSQPLHLLAILMNMQF